MSVLAHVPERRVRGLLVLAMGVLALAAPFFAGSLALFLVGILLITCGVLELLSCFYAVDVSAVRSSYLGGMLSVVGGILLLSEPRWVVRGLSMVIALCFVFDGLAKWAAAWKAHATGKAWYSTLASGLIFFGLAYILFTGWPFSGLPVVGWVMGCRMLTSGWAMVRNRAEQPALGPALEDVSLHPDARLTLSAHPEFAVLNASMKSQEEARRAIDAYWCWVFVVLFMAIHVGRMQVEWNLVGMISPFVAVLGDIGTTFFLAFGIILPIRLGWRGLTRPVERRTWQHFLLRKEHGQGHRHPGTAGLGVAAHSLSIFANRDTDEALAKSGPAVGLASGLARNGDTYRRQSHVGLQLVLQQ